MKIFNAVLASLLLSFSMPAMDLHDTILHISHHDPRVRIIVDDYAQEHFPCFLHDKQMVMLDKSQVVLLCQSSELLWDVVKKNVLAGREFLYFYFQAVTEQDLQYLFAILSGDNIAMQIHNLQDLASIMRAAKELDCQQIYHTAKDLLIQELSNPYVIQQLFVEKNSLFAFCKAIKQVGVESECALAILDTIDPLKRAMLSLREITCSYKCAAPYETMVLSFVGKESLLAGSALGELLFFDVAADTHKTISRKPLFRIKSLLVNRHNCISVTDDSIVLIDVYKKKIINSFAEQFVEVVALSPDNTKLVAGSRDGTITLIDMLTKRRYVFEKTNASVTALAIANDNKTMASANSDGKIKIWDLSNGTVVADFFLDFPAIKICFQDNQVIAVALHEKNAFFYAINNNGHIQTTTLECSNVISDINIINNNYALLTAGRQVMIWDIKTGVLLHSFVAHSDIINASCVHEDGTLFATLGGDKEIKIWDLKILQNRLKLLQQLSLPQALLFALKYYQLDRVTACNKNVRKVERNMNAAVKKVYNPIFFPERKQSKIAEL